MSLNWPVNETLTVTPGVEFRNRWFYNSANYPTAAGQSGGQWIGYVFGSGLVSAAWGLSWQGRVSYTNSDASYGPYAFDDFSIDFGLPYSFAAPPSRIRARFGRSPLRPAFPTPPMLNLTRSLLLYDTR